MAGFNCLLVRDGVILVGGVEKVLAIRTYFDREWQKWIAVVRAGQEYAGASGTGDTKTEATRHLRDGIAVIEDYRKREADAAAQRRAETAANKAKKQKAAPSAPEAAQ